MTLAVTCRWIEETAAKLNGRPLASSDDLGGTPGQKGEELSLFDLLVFSKLPSLTKAFLDIILKNGLPTAQVRYAVQESSDARDKLNGIFAAVLEHTSAKRFPESESALAEQLAERGLADCEEIKKAFQSFLSRIDSDKPPSDPQTILDMVKAKGGKYVAGDQMLNRFNARGEL